MIHQLIFGILLWTLGVVFIVYAFRDPPRSVAWLFRLRVPLFLGVLLAFVPEGNAVKVARAGLGVFLILASLGIAFQALYHFFVG